MGIVLSNAYQNSNVYSMIIPRKHLPYQYLEHLINDNVTIHTRSLDAYVDEYFGFYPWKHEGDAAIKITNLISMPGQHSRQYVIPMKVNDKVITGGLHYASEVANCTSKLVLLNCEMIC